MKIKKRKKNARLALFKGKEQADKYLIEVKAKRLARSK